MERHVKEGSFPVIPVILPGADPKPLPTYLNGYTWVAFPQTLDDEEAVHRLACYIRGTTPGLGPDKRADEHECPYRGLEFFDVAHAPYFHGREELTARLVEKLRISSQSKSPSRFLAIVCASGSGKSSLARAGLVAALKRGAIEGSEHWPVVICRPGADPCASVAVELARLGGLDLEKQAAFRDRLKDRMQREQTALDEDVRQVLSGGDSKRRMVILVDQFEELFTICRDERLRTAFVDNLVNASQIPQGQTLVLLAMRADFYGKCATYPIWLGLFPTLPIRYREPVVLNDFHEMELGAAARTMGLPEGTMKARLSRARELLRRRFPGLEGELKAHPSDKDKNVARVGHPGIEANGKEA